MQLKAMEQRRHPLPRPRQNNYIIGNKNPSPFAETAFGMFQCLRTGCLHSVGLAGFRGLFAV